MAYDIRMVKIVSGEIALGKYDEATKSIKDPGVLQTVPSQQGVQMMLMPFGYPFDNDFSGTIEPAHIIYTYKNCPEELKTKYMEACSNLTLSSGGLNSATLKGDAAAAKASGLLLGK